MKQIILMLRTKKSMRLSLFVFLFSTSVFFGQTTGCPNDFDCDGVIDALDIDDDNDGIYDHVESPNCFYLDKTVFYAGDRRVLLEVSSTLNYVSGSPSELIDGITLNNTGLLFSTGGELEGKEIFKISTLLSNGIEFNSFTIHYSSFNFFNNSSKYVLQGSQDGLTWVDLTENIIGTSINNKINGITVTKNQGRYAVYRLLGTGGSYSGTQRMLEITATVGSYMPSFHPKADCVDEDINLNGRPNHQDLDSDGDGAFDVVEAGFSDSDNDGMVGVGPVAVDVNGAVIGHGYITPLEFYKNPLINAMHDFDGDGVPDLLDVDDDNDGIYDHVESPSCFVLSKSLYEVQERNELLEADSGLPYSAGIPAFLIDGLADVDSPGLEIPAATSLADREIFRLAVRTAMGVEYSAFKVFFKAKDFFTNSSRVLLQGSNDGISWVDLSSSITPALTLTVPLTVTKNQGVYRVYRLLGVAGVTGMANSLIEINATVDNFKPSLHPRAICTGEDADGDGFPNHQDLNADADTCSDVIEMGYSDPDHDGMLGVSPVTVDRYGAVTGSGGYTVPKNLYWLDASKNVCTGAGIPVDEDSYCFDLENISNDYSWIQSLWHQTVIRTRTGYSIFGEAVLDNVYTPIKILPDLDQEPANPPHHLGTNYEGDIRLVAAGGQSGGFLLLSTEGLYAWGVKRTIPEAWWPQAPVEHTSFQRVPLPEGVTPDQIKNMIAASFNVTLLTKSGDVYIAAFNNSQLGYFSYPSVYGDGSLETDDKWHKAAISHVTSIKVYFRGHVMALTQNGDLYTWGDYIYKGDGSPRFSSSVPVKMALPPGIQVKMTAITGTNFAPGASAVSEPTYYILGQDKRVYSLGINNHGMLGIGTRATSTTWQTVLSPTGNGVGTGTGFLENIKFINASSHNSAGEGAGAIDEDGVPYLWGANDSDYYRLGIHGGDVLRPAIPNGIVPGDHDIVYIEIGGHVTPMIDMTRGKIGYVGHKVNGSMGNGPGKVTIKSYDFTDTQEVDFCDIEIGVPKKTRVTVNPMIINLKAKK
ncbi:hypothetical protein [Flavobacterium sp. JP2137]|uniref:hypothetical protein n=1 Tax=Flavobacterium sp. JP2137 TaxID=3414510 RepID=UPI003D2FA4A6